MIEIIGGAFAAGETKTFHVNGGYLEVIDAQYPCDIVLMNREGAQQSIMRASEASFFSRPAEGFATVQITSSQAQLVRVFIGSGDAGTRRVSGVVQVVDGGRARTIADSAYVASATFSAGVSAYNSMGLANPAGSGRRLIVNGIQFSTDVASTVQVRQGAGNPAGSAINPESKLIGGAAAPVSRKWSYQGPTPGGAAVAGFNTNAGGSVVVPITEPFVIVPGTYLSVANSVANVALGVYMQFYEEVL